MSSFFCYIIEDMKMLVAAFFVCITIGLFYQPKGSPAKNEQTATQSAPTPAPTDNDHKTATHTDSTKGGSPHWYTSSEWWLVIIAALTGAAIAYQAREMKDATEVMRGQLTAMQGQLGQMDSSGKQTETIIQHASTQANALTVAAAAMQDSAKVQRIAAQASLRGMELYKTVADAAKLSAETASRIALPTLIIERFESGDMGIADVEATLQFPKVKVVIKNHGQTPAFLRSWSIVFACEDLPNIPDYSIGKSCGIVLEKEIIEPNGTFTLPGLEWRQKTEIAIEDIRAIIDRKKQLWAYGFVAYYDLFGNPPWKFKFCEFANNFWAGGVQWVGGFAPEGYTGIEPFFRGTPDTAEDRKTTDEPQKAN